MTTEKQAISGLKSLLLPSKVVELEYPGLDGFKVKVAFMSRETVVNIRKKATKTTMKNRQLSEEFNEDLFIKLYSANCIKGWSGFKLEYLQKLSLVDLTGHDLDAELEYSEENAELLMRNSADFDSWISDQVTDLENFQLPNARK